MRSTIHSILAAAFLISSCGTSAQNSDNAKWVKENYTKREVYIAMRDGIKLFTAIYAPKDSTTQYPILMERTPYSCNPYGEDKLRSRLGPNMDLEKGKYIFIYQDVRGRYKSEGDFKEMTPAIDQKSSNKDVDESSDTYDTVDWLLKNTHNNGRVGLWGISYPGFYASASLPSAHPAIKAVSPQAPVTDEFVGDDVNHNGAFFLLDNFDFYDYFDGERAANGEDYKSVFDVKSQDVYQSFLDMGTLKEANGSKYFHGTGIWEQTLEHDTYDSFWQSRNLRPHLKNIKPATLVVGGWFDAEDMFGALRTYEAIEKQTPNNDNHIIMGPWTHGAWAGPSWTKFGSYQFGANLNDYFNEIETKFFNFYLKDEGTLKLPEATVFETGTNKWKEYSTWPPQNAEATIFYLQDHGGLSTTRPTSKVGFTEYVSDPDKPIPYTNGKFAQRNNEYMVEDQRFMDKMDGVAIFRSDPLRESMTVTGRLKANLLVSTTGTDADFIVKLIDVLPEDGPTSNSGNVQMAGMERLVRAEVFRGKFRNCYEHPEAFVPGKIESVTFDMNEIAHTFAKGHRLMILVQSTWFPIVDRNPQKFMRIPDATKEDFQKATVRIYHDNINSSNVVLPVLH